MQAKAAGGCIVVLLVLAAMGLGLASKIRSDRRAREAAGSLDRKAPSRAPGVQQGPGTVSIVELEQAGAEMPPPLTKPASNPKAVARMDWVELRKVVRAGDRRSIGSVRGKVGPDDAATLYALLQEIPGDALEDDRRAITSELAKLLMEIETEESSGYLLGLLTQEALLEVGTRDSILWQLGLRKHVPATSTLEIYAFEDIGLSTTSERRALRYSSMGALLHLDPERYLSRVSQELRSVPDTNLWCLTQAFRTASMIGRVDIAPAVPDLQAKFLAAPRESWWIRKFAGEALAEYANTSKSKSSSVKTWLLREVKALLDPSAQAGLDEAALKAYQDLLKFAETGEAPK